MTKIYAYNTGSEGAKALAAALECKILKREGKQHTTDVLINWGSSSFTRELYYTKDFFNHPDAIARASNKLEAFKALDGQCSIPKWTADPGEAIQWLREGCVVSRGILNGHSGKGITIMETTADWVEGSPLYTAYIKKKEEYRVHVLRGKVIFQQRKARNKAIPDDQVNWKVRNHGNGFIFANDGVVVADAGLECATKAVEALGLDFGAVDLVLGTDGVFYCLEVNTAPGLTGKTLDAYVEVFKEYI